MSVVSIIIKSLLTFAVMALGLFAPAGRIDLPFFWAMIGLFALFALASVIFLDRGLLKERVKPEAGGTDLSTVFVISALFSLNFLVAGLDARFHWSPAMPFEVQLLFFGLCALGYGIIFCAMYANKYFSPLISHQKSRGHHLISSGPYKLVRHPGYSGAVIGFLAQGLALGSIWSTIPAIGLAIVIIMRIPREEAFLEEKLEGYKDFENKVRWRLVPGVW
jgi:protein-S-isoprenylcysteine O-methyltransferase Ste14